MRALRLDYQRSARPFPWAGLAVLASALLALGLAAARHHQLNECIAQYEARIDRDGRTAGRDARALRPVSAETARRQAQEVQHANQVLRQLSLPWEALFRAVEASGGGDVALLSMEPDLNKGTVAISAEAKDFDAMLAYVSRLGERDVFGSVLLKNHQVQQADPEKPIRFSLLAEWKQGDS